MEVWTPRAVTFSTGGPFVRLFSCTRVKTGHQWVTSWRGPRREPAVSPLLVGSSKVVGSAGGGSL
jgi:hypothetical protein